MLNLHINFSAQLVKVYYYVDGKVIRLNRYLSVSGDLRFHIRGGSCLLVHMEDLRLLRYDCFSAVFCGFLCLGQRGCLGSGSRLCRSSILSCLCLGAVAGRLVLCRLSLCVRLFELHFHRTQRLDLAAVLENPDVQSCIAHDFLFFLLGLLQSHLPPRLVALIPLDALAGLWRWMRYLLLFCCVLLLVLLVYRAGTPRGAVRTGILLCSALLAALAIVVSSAVFSWFIGISSRYALVYGSLASLIILLVWLYLCGNILLLGVVFGRVLDRRLFAP